MSNDEHILKLNVGGKKYKVLETTLLGHSTKFDKLITPGSTEEIFIDRSGRLFDFVLQYMRNGKAHIPSNSSHGEIKEEFEYYGLIDAVDKLYYGSLAEEMRDTSRKVAHDFISRWTNRLKAENNFLTLAKKGVSSWTIILHNCKENAECVDISRIFDQEFARDLFIARMEVNGFKVEWHEPSGYSNTSAVQCWAKEHDPFDKDKLMDRLVTHSSLFPTSKLKKVLIRSMTISWDSVPSKRIRSSAP